MKAKFVLIPIVIIAVLGAVAFAYVQKSKESAVEHEKEAPVVAESHVKSGTNGETSLTLDKETQQRIGLIVAPLLTTNLNQELKAYGEVLDPAPLSQLVNELQSAEVTATASRQEFERLNTLGENTSVKGLQAAQAAVRKDELQVQAVKNRLLFAWGKNIADPGNLTNIVKSLSSAENAIVRLAILPGEKVPESFTTARIESVATGISANAKFLSQATSAQPQATTLGVLFLAEAKAGIVPGAAVVGYIHTGESMSGVSIPRSAVVRLDGKGWVYLQSDVETFSRREVPFHFPTSDGWFVPNGFHADDKVVVVGAQILLSEEEKNRIKMLD